MAIVSKFPNCVPLLWAGTPLFEENKPGTYMGAYEFWVSTGQPHEPRPRSLYTIWEEMVSLGMKSSQEQWENFFNVAVTKYRTWGYSDNEIRWWMLRTGQGPQCFRQFPGVGLGALPPYEIWRDWHFARAYTTGIYVAVLNNMQQFVACYTNYAPPGYVEPYLAVEAEHIADIDTNSIYTSSDQTAIFQYWFQAFVMQKTPTVSQTLGPQVAAWSDTACESGGFVHAVPPNWLILDPTVQYGAESGMCYGPNGLPIAVMFVLDKLTDRQWAQYFNERLDAHSFTVESNWRGPPWPMALSDTLTHFGITDSRLWGLQQKIYNASVAIHSSCLQKSGIQIYGGVVGQILTMICLAVISAGVLAAIAAAVEAAAVEAAVAAAAAGEEAGFAVELVSMAGDIQETVKIAQTSYKLFSQVTADDPNLLAIGASLISIGDSTGLGDLLVADVIDTSSFDFAGVEGVDFDAGESLATLDIQDAEILMTDTFTQAIDDIAVEFELNSSLTFDTVLFSGSVGDILGSAVESVVANLDQFNSAEELWAAMADAAESVVPQTVEAAVEAVDDGIGASIDEVLIDNAVLANAEDFGSLTVDELDQVEFEQGIESVSYDQQVVEELPLAEFTVTETDLEQIVSIAAKIEPLLVQSAVVSVSPPTPSPLPPTSPAQIVEAPAPEQPLPGPVATVTYPPEMAALIDTQEGIPLVSAGFGPVAPDAEKGFNLWWLLPLGLLAIPMSEKRSARRRKRK
jgi:hypothetical protein